MKLLLGWMMAACMGLATAQDPGSTAPTAEMKQMEWMVGDWKAELNLIFPEGELKSSSIAKTTMGIGGRYVVSQQTYDFGGEDYQGMLLLTYDPEKKKWVFWWFDQWSSFPIEFSGDFTGGKLTGVSKPAPMPEMGNVVYRATYEKRADGKIGFLLETQTGDSWAKVIEGVFSKS